MRKTREVLRLASLGLNVSQIHRAVGVARSTVRDYLERAERAGVSWPLPEGMDDRELERCLLDPDDRINAADSAWAVPDWADVKRELARKGVTLQLLHEEYCAVHEARAYSYSHYCNMYRGWLGHLEPVMRQHHRAGAKLFVDWAGMTVAVIDPATGELFEAQIFVATMGHSNYTYARAMRSQQQRDWLTAHALCLEQLGCVPELLVPDNTRTAVNKTCIYDPDLNPAYAELALHYGTAVMPTRPVKPRDKAKVESGVLIVERQVLARLRDRTFFGLAELNAAMAPLIARVNERQMKHLGRSRSELFETIDRPAMRALPQARYEYAEFTKARVAPDYHLAVDGHYYSVPYRLIGRQLDVRLTARTIEVFDARKRVASHARSFARGKHTTITNHMPNSHRRHAEWTPERITRWAAQTGPATAALVAQIMTSMPHPEQGFRQALGIIRLSKRYGPERVECAAERALLVGAVRYRSIKTMLQSGLDRQPLPQQPPQRAILEHANIRGAQFFTSLGQLPQTNPEGDTPAC